MNVYKVLFPRSIEEGGKYDGWDGPISILSVYMCCLAAMSSVFHLCVSIRTFLFDREGARHEEWIVRKRDDVRKKIEYQIYVTGSHVIALNWKIILQNTRAISFFSYCVLLKKFI